ncbi:MAG: 30S ribosomal protein S12 methylthiotransferase RimO [Bacteroidetes bacterium]|nr:30S ribosomal protein S12 methylthiotransferase RimO [Bacteroidota bacterium]
MSSAGSKSIRTKIKKGQFPKVNVITMGCSKNLVDSEVMMRQFQGNHFRIAAEPEDADIIIINTCGFIDAAKEESIGTILDAVEMKENGSVSKVLVTGCLIERFKSDLEREIPEVDRFFGTNQLNAVLEELGAVYKKELVGERLITTPGHFAYLKISEGCDHPCSFCAIPLMRGKHVSKPVSEIVQEARFLAAKGVRELNLIAQDLTYYGMDSEGKRILPAMLKELCKVEGIDWIRLNYAYPNQFPMELIEVMASEPKICRYLDMPIQHLSGKVLKEMRRGITRERTENLIRDIRSVIPEIALRTTLIVGFPSEGEAEFQELADGIRELKFDRLGTFTYSPEENTTAIPLGDPVPAEEKERRQKLIMEIQREISREKNEQKIGKTLKVMIDRQEDNWLTGRTESDGPEVDNEVIIQEGTAPAGSFVNVEILDAEDFDLFGRITGKPF